MWLLACGATSEPAPKPQPVPVVQAMPTGTIGGEPILERPVVLGGISTQSVEQVVGALDWMGCHRAGTGKVLVQLAISGQGGVMSAETVSTSLRQPETEECLNALLLDASFPPLERGDKAIVKYTFAY